MIIKIFKQGTKDGTDHINYLFNEEKHEGYKPQVVKGLRFLTKSICNSITNKNKFVSGVLSFDEGQNLTEEKQLRLIEMFETTFAPFEDRTRVNFLWVRHFDKGRLELHFITPRIDLKSKKAFNIHPQNLSKTNKKDSNILMFNHFTSIINYMNKWEQVPQCKTIKNENGENEKVSYIRPYSEDNFNFSKKLLSDLINKRMSYINKQYCEKKKTIYNKKTTKTKRLTNGMETNNRRQNANTLHNNRPNSKNAVPTARDIEPIVKREEFRKSGTDSHKQNNSTSTKQYIEPKKQTQSKSDNRSSTDKAKDLSSSPLAFQLQELTALYNNEFDSFKRIELYNRLLAIRYQLEIEENAKKLQEEKSNKLKP
ncbi:MAG: hypothetical protein JZU58_08765 [Curvibacter lanceolatus]|uniref:relaxase/mobilization nuclease domain-containing protein n=1 Tax=Curvibacter lanceolatus TaxID=86182 RepID=UPI002356A88B|nr:relaxase/mobilization nuclease domain-containing protein [Curvibacter lanceolatus]MBV5292434.1 hypothetical protein [Curvibacter lanceolatus]